MRSKIWFICLLVLLVMNPILAQAGKEGGGGAAHVCRDSNKKILSVELVDFYRGRRDFGYAFPVQNTSPREQLFKALEPLLFSAPWAFHSLVYFLSPERTPEAEKVFKPTFGPKGVPLNLTKDWFRDESELPPKPGCQFEQLALFMQGGTLIVQPDLWEKLDQTQIAAFYLHEVLYRHLGNNHSDSTKVQKLVAALFATKPLPSSAITEAAYIFTLPAYDVQTLSKLNVWGNELWDRATVYKYSEELRTFRGGSCSLKEFSNKRLEDTKGPVTARLVNPYFHGRPVAKLTLWLPGQDIQKPGIDLFEDTWAIANIDGTLELGTLPFPAESLRGAKIRLDFVLADQLNAGRPRNGLVELQIIQDEQVIARAETIKCKQGKVSDFTPFVVLELK